MDFAESLQNAILDALEADIGTAPLLELFTGSIPAIGAADSGTKLASLTLPSDWMAAASGNSKVKSGEWSGTAIATGNVGYFRLKTSGGTVKKQGTVTVTGGGGDMTIPYVTITTGEPVVVSVYTLAAGN